MEDISAAKCFEIEKRLHESLDIPVIHDDQHATAIAVVAGLINALQTMNTDAIVFAMANPVPEILPEDAIAGGAKVVATGRSDYPNQINNVLVFPGMFKGAVQSGTTFITDEIKLKAAEKLASVVKSPSPEKIIPAVFDDGVVDAIVAAF